jgi:creatinine amidohydrolase
MILKNIRMEEMTWPQIKAAMDAGFTTVVAAVGSTEQHGPHLPTMTDARIGDVLAHKVALRFGCALQARTIPVGCSEHHLAFPGTISLEPATLKSVLLDYVSSFVRNGFKKIVFVPSHGGNFAPLRDAVIEARKKHTLVKISAATDLKRLFSVLGESSAKFGISFEESGAHSGESETAIMLALEEKLVAKDQFAPGYVGAFGEREQKLIFEKGMPALTPNGVLGDPTKASAAHGREYLERLADFFYEESFEPA